MTDGTLRPPRLRHIDIVLPPSAVAVDILRGVALYARQRGDWRLTSHAWGRPHLWSDLRYNHADGLIAHIHTRSEQAALMQLRRPIVQILDDAPSRRLPAVVHDEATIGRLGAEHFLERGFTHFAFAGVDFGWSRARERAFVEHLAARGRPCVCLHPHRRPGERLTWVEAIRPARLARWLARLPRPVAIMACNDDVARHIADSCTRVGRRVPDDVAVLGVDNNELQSAFIVPTLSTIATDLQQLGRAAAALLDRLILGRPEGPQRIVVPPRELVVRQSTDVLALSDPLVARAVALIRAHADQGIDVRDVLAQIPLSRRALERGLRVALGCAPAQEIRRVRLAKARHLLATTDLSTQEIAARCGFAYRTYLCLAFKKAFGLSPRACRRLDQSSAHEGHPALAPPRPRTVSAPAAVPRRRKHPRG